MSSSVFIPHHCGQNDFVKALILLGYFPVPSELVISQVNWASTSDYFLSPLSGYKYLRKALVLSSVKKKPSTTNIFLFTIYLMFVFSTIL